MAAAADTESLKTELRREIMRVGAKAQRWKDRALVYPKVAVHFRRPAEAMLADVYEAGKILALGDRYAMVVALDNLKRYNHDD